MVDHINKSKPREDWVETSTCFTLKISDCRRG